MGTDFRFRPNRSANFIDFPPGDKSGGLLQNVPPLPKDFVLSPSRLLGHLRQATIVLADKAYDADWLRRKIEAAGAAPNIPPMVHRRWKPCVSPVLYGARNRIERSVNRIKYFRRLATRYEKHA